MVCWPVMSPASPVWQRVRVLWVLWALLTMLLEPWKTWATDSYNQCSWQVVLNKFETVGENDMNDRFVDQEPVDTVANVFSMLVDSPIDVREKYLGFPYYLKINYSCVGQASQDLVRKGHLMGLKPLVLVTFQYPVNFYRWKMEQLQIEMEAAPFRSKGQCLAEEVCIMNWYTPMPIKNGSVVMRVDISSNGLGPFIPPKRFYVNINGFQKRENNEIRFTVGDELFELKKHYFQKEGSRPLWYTLNHSPVLILGGISNEKAILMTDTNFEGYSLVELSIDSCWVGSYYCPLSGFSATIYDAISTESTLFIRQNQLVYYFTGSYNTLFKRNQDSSRWVRVLASECIKRLCPVYLGSNGSEYILALTTGKHEGYIHLGTIRDGRVSFQMLPEKWSVCEKLMVSYCSINWAVFVSDELNFLLLLETQEQNSTENMDVLYKLPKFIPEGRDRDFLVILGKEVYTSTAMIPKGLFYNTFNNYLYIWGNFLLQSYTRSHFIFLVDFPKESVIKYVVNSFQGDMVLVTETDEVWYFLEGGYDVHKLFPSKSWNTHVSLQVMQQSSLYASKEIMVTIFYENSQLYQLVYLLKSAVGRLVKRPVPVEKLLMYRHDNRHTFQMIRVPVFENFCPFTVMRLRDLPNPQAYTRQERYRARPPMIIQASGFHSENSLAVYQGLVYYLLWLHSKYDKPYADPVHDPTWRWWKSKTNDEDYYFYLSSNSQTVGGVYIDMSSYKKIYDLKADYDLPDTIFLDKGTTYNFSIFLTAQEDSLDVGSALLVHNKVVLSVVVADPTCIMASLKQEVFINRNSVLYKIRLQDKGTCYDQGISGHHLKKTSLTIKVVGSSGHCFMNTHIGLMVPVLIGCPPAKRLAFDITYTVANHRKQNKRYFDCVVVDPEMPCFLFRDMFYPFFLIQDLATGDSGSFTGSYVLKVVGGGPTVDTIRDYTEDEIYRYNSPLDNTKSLIWKTEDKRTTPDMAFHILSHQSSGIEWLCLENSPCHDIVPRNIFAPEFFFKVLVSNRGVDNSTYCDYQLIFLLHIHGLPLSNKRSLFIVIVSDTSVLVGLVTFYIIFCILWPYMLKAWLTLRWKINNIMVSESYYTYATSTVAFSTPSQSSSGESSKEPPKEPPKETPVDTGQS
uniref:Cation channel sperm-associated protein subunit gamma n=1 Tax=Jaculus jaculus TaxID=51337 RepID=A0A8C5KYQ1_JACJA